MTIVILGAGFGGLYTAKYLLESCKDEKVVLMDRKNHFLFTPLLHEVATGSQNRHNVVLEIREILKGRNFEFLTSEVDRIDFNRKEVYLGSRKLKYDKLVIALGSGANFFNIKGAESYALPLKTIHDAAMIRNKVIGSLEAACLVQSKEEKDKLLTFCITGGGPTGVELGAELAEWIDGLLEVNNKIKRSDVRIYLIQRGNTLMPQLMHEKARLMALRQLKKKGVGVLLNTEVKEIKKDSVVTNHSEIKCSNVFWTAGVKPNVIKTQPKIVNEEGFYEVDEYFQVKNLRNVYAIGDCALNFNPGSNRPNPQLAQLAIKQARHLAHNFFLETEGKKKIPFVFKPEGFLVSVGEWWAIAEIHNKLLKGGIAWLLWRAIYLSKILGFKNKIRVGAEWFLLLFTKRDGSEI